MGTAVTKTGSSDLQKMDRDGLIAKVEELQRSIANLGDGQVFVRRTESGLIRAVKGIVALREQLGEIQTIQKKTMITAAGACKLNQTPGLNIVTPPSVVVDGREVSNPYIEKHPKTKVIQSVYVRKVIFGPNPLGNMVGIDYTLFFNIHTYFLQDLQAKIKKYPVCGYIGKNTNGEPSKTYTMVPVKWVNSKPVDQPPKEVSTETGDWNFYELDDAGLHPVGIWVNVAHKEIQSCLDQHVQRQKFGDRHAQSICTRNALLRHPAIAAQNVIAEGLDKKRTAKVTVYGFMHDFDTDTISKMAVDISTGKVDPGKVAVSHEFMEADYEEVNAAKGTEGDEFGSSPEPTTEAGEDIPIDLDKPEAEGKEEKGNPSKEREALSGAIWEFRESKGDTLFFAKLDEFKKSKKKKSIKWPDGYSNDDLAEVLALFGKDGK